MLISVCIPVYRFDAAPVVQELLRQRTLLPVKEDVELLVYDDASPREEDWSQTTLRTFSDLRYVELEHNLGRAAIRNRMVRDARGSYCVLLDADAALPPDYLAEYYDYLMRFTDATGHQGRSPLVVVGGRNYTDEPPADPALQLHWWYGREREADAGPATQRGWLGFHSNNFLAERNLLLRNPFPEGVEGYGHEDTLWGQQFSESDLRLHRIDNAVVHLGLEPATVFLRKQHQAIRNLHRLKSQTPHLRTRLIDLTERVPLLTAVTKFLPESVLTHYLSSRSRPGLWALDLLKLKWWHEL